MPDLITHVALAHLIRRPFELRRKNPDAFPLRVLFYLGTILPDILTRPWYILFPKTHDWTITFHTSAGAALVCGMLALLFKPGWQKKAFAFLTLGSILHFVLDSFQKQIIGNSVWLYPFSWKSFNYGILWAGEIMTYIPVWLVLVCVLETAIAMHKKKLQSSSPC